MMIQDGVRQLQNDKFIFKKTYGIASSNNRWLHETMTVWGCVQIHKMHCKPGDNLTQDTVHENPTHLIPITPSLMISIHSSTFSLIPITNLEPLWNLYQPTQPDIWTPNTHPPKHPFRGWKVLSVFSRDIRGSVQCPTPTTEPVPPSTTIASAKPKS